MKLAAQLAVNRGMRITFPMLLLASSGYGAPSTK
jgi:hypothetical protein